MDEGAIVVLGWQSCKEEGSYTRAILNPLAKEFNFSLATHFEAYPKKIHDILIYGTDKKVKVHYKGVRGEETYDVAFKGLIKSVEQRYKETSSEITKAEYETFMRVITCNHCKGQRLNKQALAVTLWGKNIFQLTDMSIGVDYVLDEPSIGLHQRDIYREPEFKLKLYITSTLVPLRHFEEE